MTRDSQHIQQINLHYPDLEITSAEYNHDGQYNDVLIVNNDLVFRFAKVKPAIETLRLEIEILQHIKSKVSFPVPCPEYYTVETGEVGKAFMGYQRIPGEPLWRETFKAIPKDSRKHLAGQIALFLKELHSIKPLDSFPVRDTVNGWKDMYQRMQEKLYPLMRPDVRVEVSRHFKQFLKSPESFQPRFRHGDFGTGNILIDPKNNQLAGIIDFGFAGVGDPATDFAGLLICYGEEFYLECSKHYSAMKTALPRARFYIGTFALQEALFGIENDDAEALKAGLANYI